MDNKLMKTVLAVIFYLASGIIVSQGQVKPAPGELLAVYESGNFNELVKLGKKSGYILVDSTFYTNGKLFYMISGISLQRDVLACEADKNFKIVIMTFSTYDQALADSLKRLLIKKSYKSSGKSKKELNDKIDSEDFEKGKHLVSFSRRRKEEGIRYEFNFLNL
jgi:hypothetical protein